MMRLSGAADRFHRVKNTSTSDDRSGSSQGNIDSNQSATHGSAPGAQNIDRTDYGPPVIAGSGLHLRPDVLGRAEENTDNENQASSAQNATGNKQKSAALADLNKASRRRSFLAVKAIKSPAATKAAKRAVKGVTSPSNAVSEGNITLNSSMFTTIFYGGMEVDIY